MVALVLLPGLDGTGELFADFVAALPGGIRPIVVAYPPDQVLGYDGLEPLVRAALPQGEPYVLLAESFSGPLGIAIAASAPPDLCGLVLSCSFARNPLPGLAWARQLLDAVPLDRMPLALLSALLMGRHATPDRRAVLARSLAQVAPRVLRARAQAALAVDRSDALREVHQPVLYLRAREDRIVSRASAELVERLAPRTRRIDFPAPHFLLQVMPQAAAAAVADFVAGG